MTAHNLELRFATCATVVDTWPSFVLNVSSNSNVIWQWREQETLTAVTVTTVTDNNHLMVTLHLQLPMFLGKERTVTSAVRTLTWPVTALLPVPKELLVRLLKDLNIQPVPTLLILVRLLQLNKPILVLILSLMAQAALMMPHLLAQSILPQNALTVAFLDTSRRIALSLPL